MSIRHVLKTAARPRKSVREILQGVFAAELLHPSRCLWVVSPWIRNIAVLDNRTGSFGSLCPDFPRTEVSLSRVLQELLARGTEVVIATRQGDGNEQIIDALSGSPGTLHVGWLADLHAKGIVGDRFALHGSMNLTFNGVERLNEMVTFETGAPVQGLRLEFHHTYGGSL